MSAPTPWMEYAGIPVSIDSDGTFLAHVGDVFLRDSTWERLRGRLEQEKKAEAKATVLSLPCVALLHDEAADRYSVVRMTLAGLNRNDSTLKWSGAVRDKYVRYALPDTPSNGARLEELARAMNDQNRILVAIKELTLVGGWGSRIDASKYSEELAHLEERYNKARMKS